jgi:hypothetical protein
MVLLDSPSKAEMVLEFDLKSLHLEPLHQPFFVMGIFEIGSRELFA